MTQTPEDRMLEILKTAPPFDFREAWEEVKRERAEDDEDM